MELAERLLPVDQRFWPFYRPLGMETYFYLGHQLFGLNATGYFAISLAVHFASGFLVYRIARQLGFDTRYGRRGIRFSEDGHEVRDSYAGRCLHRFADGSGGQLHTVCRPFNY